MDISYFQKINNTYQSASKQETDLYLLNNHVNAHFADTIDYHVVKKNNEKFELLISLISSDATKKRIKARPGTVFELGDYIEWNNRMWLVIERDSDDKTYISGKIQQCNHKIRWQNAVGEIVERWAVIANASKYATGESGNSAIILPEDSFLSFLRIDEETIRLQRGQKFFLDYNLDTPTVYELTRPEPLTYSDETIDGTHHGYSNWIIQEVPYSPTKEELEHWVVGWYEVDKPTPLPDNNQSTILCNPITYTGQAVCKIGGSFKTFKSHFTDSEKNPLEDVGVWTIDCDFADRITQDISGNQIRLKVSDTYDDLACSSFNLVFSNLDHTVSTKVTINIEEIA